ncbi:GNAT family N-acetyltransferase [Kineococcus aurantiacus]|uniref:Ribosomal protein S18 acetylase RimI-like enzyme n=1 Tax=Kineococcus aurantiacus TaxID=37633 RepID=A0A7Y9AW06_9ACTN|nr:GNAT family N-acetyltransferase [Kineococcus aurantiacus]NYD21855.1 ribosomal protein S18 acetylase RimI-like enzyme [Kineococcus aurantiacus]
MPRATTTLSTSTRLTGDDLEQAWKVYEVAFSSLTTRAVQQHLMTRAEFEEVCSDERVLKYVARDVDRDDAVCAFATFSNDLSTVYQLSEDYYRARWPRQFAEGSIWYIGCVGVHPSYRSSGVFVKLVEAMCRVVHEQGGVASLDICRYNDERLALPRLIERVVHSFGHAAEGERLDEQTYWAYDFSRV